MFNRFMVTTQFPQIRIQKVIVVQVLFYNHQYKSLTVLTIYVPTKDTPFLTDTFSVT